MNTHSRWRRSSCTLLTSWLAVMAGSSALAASGISARPAMTRIGQYLMADRPREIALARSAAPPSISAHATVMVLGPHGYVTAVKGSNGFVCLVARSWDNAADVKSARFWDRTFRAPYCFNAAGARSVLTRYLRRTKWVVAGASESAIGARGQAAWAAGKLEEPAPGAMSYMMSKRGRQIGGQPGPWRPHLMFYFPREQAPDWGANLPGSPVMASAHEDTAVRYVLVPVWSDGTPAPPYR